MGDRKSLSKRTRFEIFKRDLFTCQYCGKQPPDVVLVIDHIDPVANGGDNDELNLITSCEECNQGKAAKLLTNISPRPDADIKWLEMQQEINEMKRYQEAKKIRDEVEDEIVQSFLDLWIDLIEPANVPADIIIKKWMLFASPDQIEKAIRATSAKIYKLNNFDDEIRYCSACLRNIVGGY